MDRLLSDEQRVDWLRLIMSENVGPATFRTLINRFGGAVQALNALPDLYRRGGMTGRHRIYSREDALRDIGRADALGARFVAIGEAGYPPLLRRIYKAPILLCMKGDLALLTLPAAAIVGARSASALGLKFTRQVAAALGDAGFLVVSGLARGIDTAAHQAALPRATAAVLAGGIDSIYPPENAALHAAIGERGVLISEQVPGMVPLAKHFPQRNRIIAGLSLGVVVVEAALRSGSLITARYAVEQHREVYAVPGSPLDARATGTNRLIQEGAQLVARVEDVVDGLGELLRRPSPPMEVFMQDPYEQTLAHEGHPEVPLELRERLFALIGAAPVSVDDLVAETGAPTHLVVAALLELELAGRILRLASHQVVLAE
jgi:DNA processing protein